ncbi:hypothetical protein [Roseateles asaccharophilus]|uniref:DUF2867 domain-containing protein n=1 Tax=Roseateles asaccharophilus TaxID=582607 RepID=A0ABU2AES4_9BURK|nr:hypothetical protein [Roseateles asaccharophilus]MDR7335724.1 hypothetical protein [Roseateles asaccharophilus]
MTTPTETHPPADSLLAHLAAERQAFADAYTLDLPRPVTLAEFVEAFYTTRLFKLERLVLTLFGRPSSDAAARALAQGQAQRFAAWTIQARTGDELLMHEDTGATRSWFKVEAGEGGGTRLWFGSAVVPRRRGPGGEARMSWVFHALLGVHRAYSRALLAAAARSL